MIALRILSVAGLLLSLGMFFIQISMFTTATELVVCGILGIAVYIVTVAVARNATPLGRPSIATVVVIATILGTILGLCPPRLRFGGAVGGFVLFFPVLHALTLGMFVLAFRRPVR